MKHTVKNKELDALVSLLDEPDDIIFDKVRDKLFAYGLDAVPLLEEAWTSESNTKVQTRIEEVIHQIQFDGIFAELSAWKAGQAHDLLKGFMLVAKYEYPEMNEKSIIESTGKMIQDVWLELNSNLTPLEKVKVLNHIFFDVYEFRSNKKDMHNPKNSYINFIYESKKANPISLSVIYMVIAQSLKIPVYGISLPQNFIMAYLGDMIVDYKAISQKDVQFYLNAFSQGAVFTDKEIAKFLRQNNMEPEPKYFLPCDNITIIRRVFNNLIFAFEQAGNSQKATELKKLQTALD
jgi:regulator of sirC expression with transglutaminase-like and TPR domain